MAKKFDDERIVPPKHLAGRALDLFRSVVRDYELEPRHVEALTRAAEQLMRADAAREIIDKEGVLTKDRFGQSKPHPAVEIERQAVTAAARLLATLGLDLPATLGKR